MEKTDQLTKLKYRVEGKFKMPCKLIDGTLQEFTLYLFSFPKDNEFLGPVEHFHVLIKGDIHRKENVLTRMESACTYAHLYGSQLCDCKYQLDNALINISKNKSGIYIYCLDQHGRGIGIVNHVKVYQAEQDLGLDTAQAHIHHSLPIDARNYDPIISILNHFKVKSVKLMTNNPRRLDLFNKYNIPASRVPHQGPINNFNKGELKTKKEKLGHLYSYDFKDSIDISYIDSLDSFFKNSNENELNPKYFYANSKSIFRKDNLNWLDVGCGPGTKIINILEILNENNNQSNINLDFLDPSREWLKRLTDDFDKSRFSNLIKNKFNTTWEDFKPNNKYDLITFFHSVYGIKTLSLLNIPNLLTNDGVACIVVESPNSALNKIKKALFPYVHHKELMTSSNEIINILDKNNIKFNFEESVKDQRFYVDDLIDANDPNAFKLLSFILQTKIEDHDKLVSRKILEMFDIELKKHIKIDENNKKFIEIPDCFIWIKKSDQNII